MRLEKTGSFEDGEVPTWLAGQADRDALAGTVARLRAVAGGATGRRADETLVASYFAAGPRDPAALRRLIEDPALRREVAAVGRLLGASEQRVIRPPASGRRPRRWVAVAAVAASLAALAVLPGPDRGADHRSAVLAPDELHVITPAGDRTAVPEIVWERILSADLYEVEVTGSDGRPVFRDRTTDTAVPIPDTVLVRGAPYFFRVRARLEAGRWITSDFREFTVRP